MVIPKNVASNQTVAVDPRTIVRVRVRAKGNHGRATIFYPGGKASVSAEYFGDRQIFREFVNLVRQREEVRSPPDSKVAQTRLSRDTP